MDIFGSGFTGEVLVNLARSMPAIQKLVTGASYLLGIMIAMKAVYTLKIYGESKTMMSSHGNMKEPFIYFLVAAFLLYLPTGLGIVLSTTFGDNSILSYSSGGVLTNMFGGSQIGFAIVSIIQTIGLIAFVRGWHLVAKSASGQNHQASIGKAMTHIFGGIFAINIVETVNIIYNTLGLGY